MPSSSSPRISSKETLMLKIELFLSVITYEKLLAIHGVPHPTHPRRNRRRK